MFLCMSLSTFVVLLLLHTMYSMQITAMFTPFVTVLLGLTNFHKPNIYKSSRLCKQGNYYIEVSRCTQSWESQNAKVNWSQCSYILNWQFSLECVSYSTLSRWHVSLVQYSQWPANSTKLHHHLLYTWICSMWSATFEDFNENFPTIR